MRGKRPAPRATSRTRPVRGLAREVLYAEVMVAPSTYGRAVSPETTALAPLLLADHEMLRTRLEGLLSAFHAGPGDEAAKLWAATMLAVVRRNWRQWYVFEPMLTRAAR